MSKQELVEGYIRGDVTRRTFVRRLTATGVSLAAALSYAELLHPSTASASPGEPEFYEGDRFNAREELMAPDVITQAATGVTATSAVANALVDPNRQETKVRAELRAAGTATWQETPHVIATGDTDRVVSVALSGLAASTAYEVRAVASNRSGTATGDPVTFTTAPAPAAAVQEVAPAPPPPPPPPPPPRPLPDKAGPRVRLTAVTTSLRRLLRSGILPLRLTCDEDAAIVVRASITVPVKGLRGVVRRSRRVMIASGKAEARAGRPVVVKLKLRSAGRRALKGATKATVVLDIQATDRARNTRETTSVARLSG